MIFMISLAVRACQYPPTGSAVQEAIVDANVLDLTLKTSYATDDLLLYQCKKKGASHVAFYCQADNIWTAPDRTCAGRVRHFRFQSYQLPVATRLSARLSSSA